MELQRKAWPEGETLEPLDLFRLALFRVRKARNLLCSGGILACFALGEPWNSHLLFLRRHLSSATRLLKAFCSESAFPSTVLGEGQGQGVNRCFILSTRVQPVQRLPCGPSGVRAGAGVSVTTEDLCVDSGRKDGHNPEMIPSLCGSCEEGT